MKGTLKISITDSPIDAKNVKSVNIVFTNVEIFKGGSWKSLRNFNQPVGVNLIAYSGGKSFTIIDQYTDPGSFSAIRLTLNMATRNSSLVINPQSNIGFSNNATNPIYLAEGVAAQVVLEQELGISTRGITDLTLDFDLRKSIRINEAGEYLLKPTIRVIETSKAGGIEASLANVSSSSHVVAYVYKSGQFQTTELQEQDGIAFPNAITSATVDTKNLTIGFLESGSYDIIFVSYGENGEILSVIGKHTSIEVGSNDNTAVDIDLGSLSPV